MRPAVRFRRKCVFDRFEQVSNGSGGYRGEWVWVGEAWGAFNPSSGNKPSSETASEGEISSEWRGILLLANSQFARSVDAGWRVTVASQNYRIVAVAPVDDRLRAVPVTVETLAS